MIAGWAAGLTLWVLAVLVFAAILARIIDHRIDERERRNAQRFQQTREGDDD